MKAQITITHDGNTYTGQVMLERSAAESPSKTSRMKATRVSAKAIGASDAVSRTYETGFFAFAKSFSAVEAELSKAGFHFNKSSVMYALRHAEFLQTRGAKGSYKFVQKYPPPK